MASSSKGNAMKPQFFTIIIAPSIQLQQLRIPPAFMEKYEPALQDHAFLETATGEQHKVGLKVDEEGHLWFDKGWEVFAARYSLSVGSLLVFFYQGNAGFHVLVFDKSCSEIDYPEPDTDEEDPAGEDETVGALERAMAFESENPHFIAPMQKSYLSGRYRLWVPTNFAKIYIKNKKKKKKEIQLEVKGDSNGKTWHVKLAVGLYNNKGEKVFNAKLSTGWKSFAKENGLSRRDVCVFELIDKEADAYMVYIYRGN